MPYQELHFIYILLSLPCMGIGEEAETGWEEMMAVTHICITDFFFKQLFKKTAS